MNYNLTILTSTGEKSGVVSAPSISAEAPFGLPAYRGVCTCALSQADQTAFWDLVDQVLTQHSLSSSQFIRAVRAVVI